MTGINRFLSRFDKFTWVILAAALLVRVGVILIYFRTSDLHGSDSSFYIDTANHLTRLGFADAHRVTSIGPGYPLFLAPFYNLIPDSKPLAQIIATRLVQAAADAVTVAMIYLLTYKLFEKKAARIALVLQAADLRYIFVAGSIATETLFIMCLIGAVTGYYVALDDHSWALYRLAGILLGLSILIRPVGALLLILIIPHLLFRSRGDLRGWQGLGWLVISTLLICLPWILRSSLLGGGPVPGANTVFSHFWLSTHDEGRDLSSNAFYEEKTQIFGEEGSPNPTVSGAQYVGSGISRILQSPGEWVNRVAVDTVKAYVQPFGTTILTPHADPGLRDQLRSVVKGERQVKDILQQPGLFRRLLMYVWHYWGLVGGIAGMALVIRQKWWDYMPLIGWVVGTTAATAILLIEPRYLFPVMFVFTIFAAHTSVKAWELGAARAGS